MGKEWGYSHASPIQDSRMTTMMNDEIQSLMQTCKQILKDANCIDRWYTLWEEHDWMMERRTNFDPKYFDRDILDFWRSNLDDAKFLAGPPVDPDRIRNLTWHIADSNTSRCYSPGSIRIPPREEATPQKEALEWRKKLLSFVEMFEKEWTQEQCKMIKQELIAQAYHPRRVEKWVEYGGIEFATETMMATN